MKYESILAAFYSTPWAITESWHSNLEHILLERARGVRPSSEEIRERIAARADYRTTQRADEGEPSEIAVISIHGPIIPRADFFSEMSGGASHQGIAKAVREAADDDRVKEIVLDIASPGGTVEGVDIAVAAVRYAAGKKPVATVSEGMLCSAAYWIGSQANRIVASPASMVGSIGVLAGHRDFSKMEAGLGVKTTIFRSAPHKAVGHPSEELNETARADIQKEVDDLYAVFIDDVAAGRGRSAKDVREMWGQGQVWVADEALSLGLIDEVGTLHGVLYGTETSNAPTRRGRKKAKAMDEELTLEALREQHPELFEQVKALGYQEGRAAGLTEGKALGQKEAQAQDGNDPKLVELEKTVAKLSADLTNSQREAKEEKRRSIAVNALEAAKLPEFPKVEGMDLAASFRERLEGIALGAENDAAAQAAVDKAVTEQKAIMGGRTEKARQVRPLVPSGNNDRKADDAAEPSTGSGVASVLRSQGLRA